MDSGFIVERGSDTNVGFIWDESADQFSVINTTEIADDNDITIQSYATLKGGSFLSVGSVGIGTDTPSVKLDINSTDAIKIPVGTTAQRPTAANGMLRLNTTTAQFEGYQNSAWQGLGGVIDVDQDTYISTEKTSDDDTLFFYTAGSERARLTSAGLFRFVDNAKATFGAGDDLQIYHDGSNSHIKNTGSLYVASETSGDLHLRSDNDINLDSDNGYFYFKDGGTSVGLFKLTSSNFYIKSTVADKDLIFQGNDGGSTVTALTLDMSAGGNAIFNDLIKTGNLSIGSQEIDISSGDLTLDVAGDILLDADGADVRFLDGGADYFKFSKDGNNSVIKSLVSAG